MRRRWTRALRRIERDLAATDPGLDAFFASFAARSNGCDMSWVEKANGRWRPAFGRRRGERNLGGRMKDWCNENWKDP
jgi:hypothetical protein